MGRGLRIGHSATQNRTMPAAFGGYTVTGRDAAFVYGSSSASIPSNPVTTARNATGAGTRYDVTTDAEFDAVPWGALVAGDVVNVFWKSTPYARKWAMRSRATSTNPIYVWGVTNASGDRPRFNFAGASTALGCNPGLIGGNASLNIFNTASPFSLEDFGGVIIRDAASGDSGVTKPCWITIANLEMYGSGVNASFTGLPATTGGSRPALNYIDSASGIRVQRGADITIDNCVVHNCPWGFYSHISSGLIADICERMTLRNSRWYDGGRAFAGTEHNVYIQCINPVVEGNYFGPLITNSDGAAYKSRCAGEIFRYNWVETHARACDWVEMEEQTNGSAAGVDVADYGIDHIYGNVIVYDDSITVDPIHPVHFGGDKSGQQEMLTTGVPPPGAEYTSPTANGKKLYRQLAYFYSNTYICRGKMPIRLFDINEESSTMKLWNNLVVVDKAGSAAYGAGVFAILERAGTLQFLGGNLFHAISGSTLDDTVLDGLLSSYTDVTWCTLTRTVSPITTNPLLTSISTQTYTVGASSPARSLAVSTPSGLPGSWRALPVEYMPVKRSNGMTVRSAVTTSGAFEYA